MASGAAELRSALREALERKQSQTPLLVHRDTVREKKKRRDGGREEREGKRREEKRREEKR
jgi:hypothetical protein